VAVTEEPVDATPFGTLPRLKRDVATAPEPRVSIVALISGHFAALLRGLVRTMLPDHDICITDWHNARDVSAAHAASASTSALHEAPPPAGRGRPLRCLSGKRWETQVYPTVRNIILASE
jgi:poly-beta-hydroxyalkanoate depolymerase